MSAAARRLARPARLAALATIAALAPALAGCADDALTARDVYGVYVLASPFAATAEVQQQSDTLFLEDQSPVDGPRTAGRQKIAFLVQRAQSPDSPPDSLVSYESRLTFAVRGDEVLISFSCPPNAICVEGPHLRGPLVDGVLVLRPAPYMSIPTQRYRRIARP